MSQNHLYGLFNSKTSAGLNRAVLLNFQPFFIFFIFFVSDFSSVATQFQLIESGSLFHDIIDSNGNIGKQRLSDVVRSCWGGRRVVGDFEVARQSSSWGLAAVLPLTNDKWDAPVLRLLCRTDGFAAVTTNRRSRRLRYALVPSQTETLWYLADRWILVCLFC